MLTKEMAINKIEEAIRKKDIELLMDIKEQCIKNFNDIEQSKMIAEMLGLNMYEITILNMYDRVNFNPPQEYKDAVKKLLYTIVAKFGADTIKFFCPEKKKAFGKGLETIPEVKEMLDKIYA